MGKFGPTAVAPIFGYDFFLLVTFFGTTLYVAGKIDNMWGHWEDTKQNCLKAKSRLPRQYYTLLEQRAIILIFISIIDVNVNLSKNEIDKKINLS